MLKEFIIKNGIIMDITPKTLKKVLKNRINFKC